MSLKSKYLILYNSLSALLWLRILVTVLSTPSPPSLYSTLEPWTRWTQTLAVLEILHAATGITRSAVFTTFTQIFTRCVQVWAVCYGFPNVAAEGPMYRSMLLAWSTADVVRYLYFVVMLVGVQVPSLLKWMRYTLFFVLYPIGIGGEWWMMFKAAESTSNSTAEGIFYFCLGLYVPGAVMMYSYMVKQRKKTLSKA
ncbi:hypothetical protein ASPWEDRAFT_168973 [Aspergillus wentii DTO 134E9]|uniref:Very-long-chain (3R)-3-hydroxyacyl-CoA dehydratase n=1 Tax=Aspergillus wentii DTO 134E9 TaxID=1073089 RepID=A0A1L9RW73_ASPWE|nr:uncharacterized protein ASPWEDRAFT_168973 [Aspergillus wentii DTO 134E9]KAI9929189.1 hypothetical protein MW887_001593 [Aspergillus wentii]OJJ39107.1 hypothetical protein ASPWEDRAFT_168973 [Aspergillus wentii DTO 134E9]